MTYSGWTNYETWNVKPWMDNDEGGYHYWRDATKEATSAYDLARLMQAEHEENMPELTGTYADMLMASLREVNWLEIAEHMIEDETEDE